jgi:hypothetical protein
MMSWLGRSRVSLIATAFVALAVTTAPSTALADPASDAKDLFSRGRELRAQGDCASAAGIFRKAYELFPTGLGSLRNLAECEESLGHYASARRAWLDLKRATLTSDDKKYEGWGRDADAAAARLAPKLATVTIDLTALSAAGETVATAGVDVTLDGEKLAPSLLGTALERDPGRYVVRAGGERVRGRPEAVVDLAAGDAKHVALRVVVERVQPVATERAAALLAVAPRGDDGAERARATKRTIAWTAIGVGAASLAGAAVSFVVRQSALDTVDRLCVSHQACAPQLQSTASRGQTASVLVNVFGAIGAASAVGGVVLLTTTLGSSTHTALVVTPTVGGASATLRF